MIGVMDCNNFFVSCERLFRPDLWGKPVAVLSSNDGCIVARSNEVKALGVPMGIPLFQAKQLVDFKDITLFSSNFTLYRDISSRVMQILAEEIGECEIYSVDEAFFKVDERVTTEELVLLRKKIMQKTGIPVSIGVGSTKTLAKIAVEQEKKGSGVCILTKDKWHALAASLPCSDIWNIGRQTTIKLRELGIETAEAFMALDQQFVKKQFGIFGRRIQDELGGRRIFGVGQNSEALRQSLMSSRSFAEKTSVLAELESALSYHISEIAAKLRQRKLVASRLYVSVYASRHSDWARHGVRGEVILAEPSNTTQVLTREVLQILQAQFNPHVPYKKAGVTAAGLYPESYQQLGLFEPAQSDTRNSIIDRVTDSLNLRFGHNSVRLGTVLRNGPRTSAELRSKEYTTRWRDIPNVQAK